MVEHLPSMHKALSSLSSVAEVSVMTWVSEMKMGEDQDHNVQMQGCSQTQLILYASPPL